MQSTELMSLKAVRKIIQTFHSVSFEFGLVDLQNILMDFKLFKIKLLILYLVVIILQVSQKQIKC